jgi:CYTH domain-containing protein
VAGRSAESRFNTDERPAVISQPKYAIPEIERRWLVETSEIGSLDEQPHRVIEDRYITGTRLRLRKMTGLGGEPVFKFCKKYGRLSVFSEPITNLYLTQAEYDALSQLPGVTVKKRRYAVCGGSLDLYEGSHAGLAVFEVAFESEEKASGYTPPGFVRAEITHEVGYSGASLAGREPRHFSRAEG